MIDCSFESCNIWKGFYLVTKPDQKEAEDCHGILHKGVWRSEVSEAGPLQKVSKMGTNQLNTTDPFLQTFLCLGKVSFLGNKTMFVEHPMSPSARWLLIL